MSLVATTDPRFNRGMGLAPGQDDSAFLGARKSITIVANTFETLWDVDGNFTWQTAGEQLELISSDAADALTGIGAQKVLVSGKDTSYVPQIELVEMNGTSAVTTTRTDWLRNDDPLVVLSGTNQRNVGTITLRVAGGGLVRATILPQKSRSFNGFTTVPLGRRMFITQPGEFTAKGLDMEIENQLMIFGTNTWISGGIAPTYQSSNIIRFESLPNFPEKTDIETTAATSGTSITGSLQVEYTLVDNAQVEAYLASFHSKGFL